jgi:hypothetical protein
MAGTGWFPPGGIALFESHSDEMEAPPEASPLPGRSISGARLAVWNRAGAPLQVIPDADWMVTFPILNRLPVW